MLWVAFFCCLLMVYALSSWLPKLMNAAGYGLNSSLAFLLVLNFGAIIGPLLGGALHAAQLPIQASFLAFALPGLVGAAAILVFLWQRPAIAAQAEVALEKPLS